MHKRHKCLGTKRKQDVSSGHDKATYEEELYIPQRNRRRINANNDTRAAYTVACGGTNDPTARL